MNGYIGRLEEAIRATIIYSTTTYSWFEKRSEQLPPTVKRALTPESARAYLLFNLETRLYADFYCHGFARPTVQEAADPLVRGMTPFVEVLSGANRGSGYREDGWEVRAIEDGKVVVRRDGLELWVRPEDCLAEQGSPIGPGMRLSLRFPKDLLGISPGFYMALGDERLTSDTPQDLVRFYFNITGAGAVQFVQTATSLLNSAHLPFKLKVLNDPARFTRCDAAVVYVRKSNYGAASEMLARIYPRVSTSLRPVTPAFTKPLAPGVGFAEDPGGGESFGLHRCRLLADGMIRAYEQGKKSVNERLEAVVDRFAEEGISVEKPFLNPNSTDDYEFQVTK